jgi:hypothetical protein
MAATKRTVELFDVMSDMVVRIAWPAGEEEEPVVRFFGQNGKGVPASVVALAAAVLRNPDTIAQHKHHVERV